MVLLIQLLLQKKLLTSLTNYLVDQVFLKIPTPVGIFFGMI
jgi:hypothetical protein